MSRTTSKSNRANRKLPTLIAVGGGLAALPAAAVELGDLTIHSRLGQPLRASIAYALAPNEQLSDYCVSLRPASSVGGLPNVGRATISVADGIISLTGNHAIREPMVSAHVMVDCPYTANISREYMLFIDPVTPAYQQTEITQPTGVAQQLALQDSVAHQPATRSAVAKAAAQPRPTVQQATVSKDISKATRYRVQPGDSLSRIVQRIENRPMSLWPAVNTIFDANPDAFLDNDPNKLKAGSWLFIPSFDGSEPVVATTTEVNASAAAATAELAVARVATAEIAVVELAAASVANSAQQETAAVAESTAAAETPVIPDTQLEGPTTTSVSPNVPTASITAKPTTSTPQSANSPEVWWLAGSGIAVLFGLLVFGRRLRNRPTPAPISDVDSLHMRRNTDVDTNQVEAIGVDYDLSDDSPTEENLVLDADLFIGTGLENGTEMNVAQEYSFADSVEETIELPFEPEPTINEVTVFSSSPTSENSILDSEVFPDDDQYDMSVIVDATKMPQPEDATEYDFQAVEVDSIDESMVTDAYTINDEIDFQILEQDYEDEMTATQALNEEITRAAAELAESLNGAQDSQLTAALPLAKVIELDVTAHLPANQDVLSDLDDTGINETLTVNIAADDKTAEMNVAVNDDETIEMTVESGKVG